MGSYSGAKSLSRCFALFILGVVLSMVGIGQTGTSSVTGTVKDGQGNLIPGATVRLFGGQGGARTTTTNNSGLYSFSALPPGTYKVEVEAAGFKKAAVSEFQALVDISTEVNVSMEVGAVTEVVNVEATGIEGIVNTQDASLGNNFVSQQISQLPLNARNVSNLLSLQPGVTPDGSVTGGRSDQANITLDGIDVNNQQEGTAFAPVLRVNPDSVEEFRVTTSNPDAAKGRSSGAQISLITRSGSNQWQGALYEYHRNTITSANNWFSNAAGSRSANDPLVVAGLANAGDMVSPREKLIRNLFGGRLGGPIVKDRLFFFYNYEGLREARETAVTRLVPLAHLGAGRVRFMDTGCSAAACGTARAAQSWDLDINAINGLTINGQPVVNVNPVALAVLTDAVSRYPSNVTAPGDGINTGGYRFNAPTPAKQNAHTARFDWNVTGDQEHQLSFRANYNQDLIGFAPYLPDTPPTDQWSHPLGFQASHTWLINTNLTNRFSAGLTRMAYSNQGDSADPAISFRFLPASRLCKNLQPCQSDLELHR